MPLHRVVHPLASVLVALGARVAAMAVVLASLPLAFVDIAAGIHELARSLTLVSLPQADEVSR